MGLIYLACPPRDREDWRDRQAPDHHRLRAALAPLAPAFELTGDGPRFLQALERLDAKPSPPDMLFIDSAGHNTARNNADLMVRRGRYPALDLPLAAMALYTLQAYAPSGGAGNRTSMRGGGPLVCIVEPREPGAAPLWSLVWANVPDGVPAIDDLDRHLPWLRPTATSEKGQKVFPPRSRHVPPETFFGMPRRLRLVVEEGQVTGVVQRPHGTNYALWRHPLTPYYRAKPGGDALPLHPSGGVFGYREWLGVALDAPDGLREVAGTVQTARDRKIDATLIVGGWAMDNMKPRDFVFSRSMLLPDDIGVQGLARGMIEAAELIGRALAGALKGLLGAQQTDSCSVTALRETFYLNTQTSFETMVARAQQGEGLETEWLNCLTRNALSVFDGRAIPGLPDLAPERIAQVVYARRNLARACAGRTKLGLAVQAAMGLTPPERESA